MSEVLDESVEPEKDWIDIWVENGQTLVEAHQERTDAWVDLTDSSFETAENSNLGNLARFCKNALAYCRASRKIRRTIKDRPPILFDLYNGNQEEWDKMVRVGIVELPTVPPLLASDLVDSDTTELPFI